jgi:hypothetical protein
MIGFDEINEPDRLISARPDDIANGRISATAPGITVRQRRS